MFDVVWSDPALDQLADVYVALDLAAQDRVAAGVAALNRRLARDPHDEGESRAGDYRITFPDLLMVSFRVLDARREVQVTAVSRSGR